MNLTCYWQKLIFLGEISTWKKVDIFLKNINFVLETHTIAQMKGILILIKSYKNTLARNEYLTLFWCSKDVPHTYIPTDKQCPFVRALYNQGGRCVA